MNTQKQTVKHPDLPEGFKVVKIPTVGWAVENVRTRSFVSYAQTSARNAIALANRRIRNAAKINVKA